MAGTTPLIIHVPAREPMSNKIMMEGMADPIVFTTFTLMSDHL